MGKKYYLGFSLFPGIGSVLFAKLLNAFGTAEKAWHAKEEKFQKIVGEKLTEKFVAFRQEVDLEKELEKCTQLEVALVTLEDKEYPELLKQACYSSSEERSDELRSKKDSSSRLRSNNKGTQHLPPFLLYAKGNISVLSSPKTIGIVGTRKMTPYGRYVTEMLTTDLVAAGFVTVSGLALGVDACSHATTIKQNGKTIAVLGCGVDCCYPRENQKVYDDILASGGVIISAFPVGMQGSVGTFPARNKIIAGLSQAVLVTEGAKDSGSLITASDGKKLGRPVFSVPGPITSNLSKGANSLLQDGAIAVIDARDIIATLQGVIPDPIRDLDSRFYHKGTSYTVAARGNDKKEAKGDTKEEQDIIDLLEISPLHFDEIVRKMKKDSKTVGSLLSLMELKGMIKSNASMYSLS